MKTDYDPYFNVQDKNEKEVVLKAMGQAISKAVAIGEIIKVHFPLNLVAVGFKLLK